MNPISVDSIMPYITQTTRISFATEDKMLRKQFLFTAHISQSQVFLTSLTTIVVFNRSLFTAERDKLLRTGAVQGLDGRRCPHFNWQFICTPLGEKKVTSGICVSIAGYFYIKVTSFKFSNCIWNLHLFQQPMFSHVNPTHCFLPGVPGVPRMASFFNSCMPSIIVKLDPLTLAFTWIPGGFEPRIIAGIFQGKANQHMGVNPKIWENPPNHPF